MEPLAPRPRKALPPGPRQVYKILALSEWQDAVRAGAFTGNADDVRDGFIHLSAAPQVAGTLARHYASRTEPLVLLTVDLARVDGEVIWEPSRDGALFPHVYGVVPVVAVLASESLSRETQGGWRVPALPVAAD